ncbi:MAG: hypothetical protein IJI66_11565 [Erysipelotrichaceae bacterium]|nr:hypothetical protein [Erysipelotrichaceae bacterium]
MFFRKKVRILQIPENRKPVIRVSICTGEQVAGFKNLSNGKFEEVVLIRNRKDLDDFKEKYGITDDLEKIY